jgi:hypothetical protein
LEALCRRCKPTDSWSGSNRKRDYGAPSKRSPRLRRAISRMNDRVARELAMAEAMLAAEAEQ